MKFFFVLELFIYAGFMRKYKLFQPSSESEFTRDITVQIYSLNVPDPIRDI